MKKSYLTRTVFPAMLGLSALIFAGCPPVGPNYTNIDQAWKTGNTSVASQEILKNATKENVEKYDERIRWMLNAGSIAGIDGNYAESEKRLSQAQTFIDAGSLKGDDNKSVGTQISNFVTGAFEPAMQEYVMIPVLQLYNALGIASPQEVLTSKALTINDTQKQMLDRKAETLFKAQQDESKPVSLGEGDFKVEINLREEIDRNDKALRNVYPEEVIVFNPKEEDIKSVYTNPFAYWLSGIIALHTGETKDQVLNAMGPIEDALKMDPTNPFLLGLNKRLNEASSASTASGVISGVIGDEKNYTYVIYEGGKAPAIGAKAQEIEIPQVLNVALKAIIVGASQLGAKHSAAHAISAEWATAAVLALPNKATAYFPTLSSRGKAPEIKVNGVTPTLLVDFDPLLAKRLGIEAKGNLRGAIWSAAGQIAFRGVTIAGSLASLNVAIEKNNAIAANLAVRAFQTSVANAAKPLELSHPDNRTWNYLPRTISVAELVTPKNGKIDISGESIQVPAEGVNFVRIYKADESFPAVVQVFTITPDGKILAAPVSRLSAPGNPSVAENAKQ